MHRRAWIRRAALSLALALCALSAVVRPDARAVARAGGAAVVATHAAARLTATRAAEPQRVRGATTGDGAMLALPPHGTLAIGPAPSRALAPDRAVPESPHDRPSPVPTARGPPPSA